jgi:hypothetical protein
MRKPITYANVVATIALFLSMSGGALAAKHYLLSSPKQISPKVLKSLETKNKALFNKLAKTTVVAKASFATSATSATSAGSAGSATHASSADTASNSGLLGGLSASQLVRATSASTGTVGDPCEGGASLEGFTSETFTNVATSTITVPEPGILMVWGHSSSEWDSSSTAKSFLRLLGRLALDGAKVGAESETSLDENSHSCQEGRTMSLDTAIPVTAGKHTVAFQVAKSATTGGTGQAYVGDGSVTALFVPFGSTGTAASLAARPRGTSGPGNG